MVIARTRYLLQNAIVGQDKVIALTGTLKITRLGWRNIARKAAAAEVLYYMKMI